MTDQRVRVVLDGGGGVKARHFGRDLYSPAGQVELDGLDGELVGHFERWLSLRERDWRREEIASFGRLLHRCLFPPSDGVWTKLQQWIRESDEPVRLTLQLPTGRDKAYLAAIPWEYLHTTGPGGYFLAADPKIVLSRWAPTAHPAASLPALTKISILPVVSDPSRDKLGPVDADEVLETLTELGNDPRFDVRPMIANRDVDQLRSAVATAEPDVVHFMGHGRFTREVGGGLAMIKPGGIGWEWVEADRVAAAFCPGGHPPRAVVLHTCEGGIADTTYRFAGLAPELIKLGVQCVIAMQYPIRNDTAKLFSTTLYAQLAAGRPLDEAVQGCREVLSAQPRLLGLPVLYQYRADPLLSP
jgi:hypothetical protein